MTANNKPLLVLGPDSTLRGVHSIANQMWPQRQIAMLHIPSTDYYRFDLSALAQYTPSDWDVCIAVNEYYINDVRRALSAAVKQLGYAQRSIISPQASIDPSAIIGENVIVYPGCVIGPNSIVGNYCVLRANVVLSEDVVIGDFVTLEANVAIREGANVGDFTTICANSSLTRMTKIGKHCYLNLQRQYSGVIADMTFYSPTFENPVRVLSSG